VRVAATAPSVVRKVVGHHRRFVASITAKLIADIDLR
jgi:hypothetical protein